MSTHPAYGAGCATQRRAHRTRTGASNQNSGCSDGEPIGRSERRPTESAVATDRRFATVLEPAFGDAFDMSTVGDARREGFAIYEFVERLERLAE